MKQFIKAARVTAVTFAVVLFTFGVAQPANASLLDDLNLNLGGSSDLLQNLGGSQSSQSSSQSSDSVGSTDTFTLKKCNLTTNFSTISYNGSVNLAWDASGFNNITVNGQSVSEAGSMTVTNITVSTIFKLTSSDGCTQTVNVTCLPPPVLECKLQVLKTVDKANAKPGDEITYTITVKNTGTGNCTGGGVKIEDKIDPYLEYLSYTYSGDVTPGYQSKPVYQNHTLYFNGNTLTPGETVIITWKAKVKTPAQCGDFQVTNQAKATAKELNNFLTWVTSQIVKTDIDYDCQNPVPTCDTLTATPASIVAGNSSVLAWQTTNATRVTLNNAIGEVLADGNKTVQPLSTVTYILSVFGPNNQLADTCEATVTVTDDSVPFCKSFTATPSNFSYGGGTTTLAWEVERATSVSISPTVGSVGLIGTKNVLVSSNTNYVLTAIDGNGDEVTCPASVTVEPPQEVFTCGDNVIFTSTDYSIKQGEGATLNWNVTGADSVSITPINATSSVGNQSVSPTSDTTYTLTATKGSKSIDCPLTVEVEPPVNSFTCENNVNISVSDSSITRGGTITLDWSVTGADSVSVNPGGYTGLTGSESLSPSDDTTYTLTATKSGFDTINCPVSLNVSSGGGGGGSSSPRCELTISDKKIKRGEEITLTWDTSRATEITLVDDRGKVLFSTEDMLSKDKRDHYDDSFTVKPTRDTEYTLIAERGTRDRECNVKVELDDLTVLQTRDQKPLVAGIALTNVPYTGFEAGPILTLMFYVLLMAWALYVAYFLVLRQRTAATNNFTPHIGDDTTYTAAGVGAMKQAESIRPDAFAASAVAEPVDTIPSNLPVAALPKTVGYESYFAGNAVTEKTVDAVVTELENRAHHQKALLSSDAVEYFMKTTEGEVERNEALDSVISEAKKHYPLEDGWVVINEARMQGLCETCVVKNDTVDTSSRLPGGSGSLAESIVTGNIVAAYEMIGNRPMFALADAASEFDAVYRNRQGGKEIISDMLLTETAKLSDVQIQNIIKALTGALDGTYSDEASAVKMAIMKAVKEIV